MDEAGRSYARIYQPVRRGRHHELLEQAVVRSGGRVVTSTGPGRAPLFLGIEDGGGRSLAMCAYVFWANHEVIKNRPQDEHRFQVRYGDVNSASWKSQDHPVGFDPLGADTTLIVGVHEEADLIIAADPIAYDPLPLGISIFLKDAQIEAAQTNGWHVWERDNFAGALRGKARTSIGLETLVAFRPERLLDYLRFEHSAQLLGLDPALRYRAAEEAGAATDVAGMHDLERQFALSSAEILDIIDERPRLGMAVRGGVAERHLHKALELDRDVDAIDLGKLEGPPDFIVQVSFATDQIRIECKNASPRLYSNGDAKVETQKTRVSKQDPKSRLYSPDQFDLVAACMYGPTGRWEYRYKRSDALLRSEEFADRIAPIQRIDDSWSDSLSAAWLR